MRDGDTSSGLCVPPSTGARPGRLKARAEFLAVAAGRRFHTARVTVQGLRRDAPGIPTAASQTRSTSPPGGLRVGFTVTKRTGQATERNRIRRRLRAAVDCAALSCSGLSCAGLRLDVVLVGRRDALAAPFAQLVEDVARGIPAVAKPKAVVASGSPPHHGRGRGASAASRVTSPQS